MNNSVSLNDAKRSLWLHKRCLFWKLDTNQRGLYEQFLRSSSKKFVLNCSRRIGKSYLLCLIGIEQAIRQSNSQIRFAAPSAKALKKIVLPIMREIMLDCPKELEPQFRGMDSVYVFPNGSEIHLAGADGGNAESLRGTAADLCLVDEAGFIDELDYLVKDILMPQLMYAANGKILIASTPPKTPAHDFVRYIMQAEIIGSYAHRTIYENPRISKKEIDEAIEECGGEDTTTFKREYMAQVITESTQAIIPEFTEAAAIDVIREVERPPRFHAFTVGDLGFRDATAILFGYYDFKGGRTVIEDELILHAPSSSEIARGIKEKETSLWGEQEAYQRFADGDLIALQDISKEHGVWISPVKKDALEAQVNCLRLEVQHRSLIIHPRCKTTVAHLKYGIWDKHRRKFERSDEFFHFDALAALIYFVRHVSKEANPYPWDYKMSSATHFIPEEYYEKKRTDHSEWKKLLGGR